MTNYLILFLIFILFGNIMLSHHLPSKKKHKPQCGILRGDENGHWIPYKSIPPEFTYGLNLSSSVAHSYLRYELDECKLKRYTPQEVRNCLKYNSPIAFIGQSVMRYQYLYLRQFLEEDIDNTILHSVCDTRVIGQLIEKENANHRATVPPAILNMGKDALRWSRFFQNTSSQNEICDCGRPNGYKNPFVENRIYFHPDKSFKIMFFWVIGDRLSHGHIGFENLDKKELQELLSKRCCNTCGAICSKLKDKCSILRYPGNCFLPIKARVQQKLYKKNKYQSQSISKKDFFWTKNINDLLLDISETYKPKVLILGTLYEWLKCDFERKLNLLSQVKHISPTTRAFYRTCPTVKEKKTQKPVNHDDECFRKASKSSKWGILDTNYIIRRLWEYDLNVAQDSYYDHIHFKCFVYRELNNVLLNRLCNGLYY